MEQGVPVKHLVITRELDDPRVLSLPLHSRRGAGVVAGRGATQSDVARRGPNGQSPACNAHAEEILNFIGQPDYAPLLMILISLISLPFCHAQTTAHTRSVAAVLSGAHADATISLTPALQ